jgi:hypothetical protein
MHRLKGRLTYGNVIATIALFVALGGSSYAAITLPRNSVGANQLRTGSVRTAEVRDRSLAARDLSVAARNFLKSQQGAEGPRGPQGPAGPQGPQGPPGSSGGTVFTIRTASRTAGGDQDPDSIPTTPGEVTCNPGERVTGGGANVSNPDVLRIHDSHPVGNNTWRVSVGNDATSGQPFTVYAICAL